MKLSRFFIFVVLSGFFSFSAIAAESEKIKSISTLIRITQMEKIALQMADGTAQQFMNILKQSGGNKVPERAFVIVQEEIHATFKEGFPAFEKLIVAIYDKQFTHQEIKDLLTFYETPTGKKALRVLPAISQEGMVVGQKWGESLVPALQKRITDRFKKEGIQ